MVDLKVYMKEWRAKMVSFSWGRGAGGKKQREHITASHAELRWWGELREEKSDEILHLGGETWKGGIKVEKLTFYADAEDQGQ